MHWPLAQATGAAAAAWLVAQHVAGHERPFFAPMAAVVALNAAIGERGRTAVRLVAGVLIGIVVGEATVALLFGFPGTVALAVFVAMAIARALGGARTLIVQAASSAILTVAVADGQVGLHRLMDALIGGGVALLFTQVLFSPDPVAFLRRAEAAALSDMADALALNADALESGAAEPAARAATSLRDLRDELTELRRVTDASSSIARHSLVWRSKVAPLVREREEAGHLDLLGGSCLLLARVLASRRVEPATLLVSVRGLAAVLRDLSHAPGDHAVRQHAVDRALAIAHARDDAALEPAVLALRMIIADLMVFAGVAPDEALAAARGGLEQYALPPAAVPGKRFAWRPWRRRA